MQYHARAVGLCASADAEISKTGGTGPPQGRHAAPGRHPCRLARPAAPHRIAAGCHGTGVPADGIGTQKYERAANRISASRLFQIGKVLDVKVPFFYEGYEEAGAASGFAEPPAEAFQSDLLQRRDTIELFKAFYAIDDAALRRRLLDLARTLAAGSEPK